MSRAEDRALDKYPKHSVLIQPARRGGYYADIHLREGFIEGYHQAEKDNELTWEDIRDIVGLYFTINLTGACIDVEKHSKEVLKRFKERKIYENNK